MDTTLLLIVFLRLSFGQIESHPANLQQIWDNFQCFDDQKVNYFINDPSTEIFEGILPQVRIMMGGWVSQSALNFAAALFMKEKLGMNVTFWPTLDPDLVWNGQFWDNWNGSLAWPRNMFAWLADDEMDINFEYWPDEHAVKHDYNGQEVFNAKDEFFIPGTVDFGGSVGPYSDQAIWIPQYIVDEYPDFIIPSVIRDNNFYRELLMNASRGIGGNCDDEALNSIWGSCTGVDGDSYIDLYFDSDGYDEPTYDKPIVWGSVSNYLMSEYAYDLLNAFPFNEDDEDLSGINVSYVTTGSESALAEIVSDMYKRRLPFIANIYTADINFGAIDPFTGDLQEFVKMAFPTNHDQSKDADCFKEAQCQFPTEQLEKAANFRLEERFPEAFEFYHLFSMPTSQLHLLESKYVSGQSESIINGEYCKEHSIVMVDVNGCNPNYPDYDSEGMICANEGSEYAYCSYNVGSNACVHCMNPTMGSTVNSSAPTLAKWLSATCDWMKDPASFTTWNRSSWHIDIERYNCFNGCGIQAADGEYYGGSCDYFTGQCVCDYPELFASTDCKSSCPGLVGPYANASGDYVFDFCSGHGVCDITSTTCNCENGYGGNDCSVFLGSSTQQPSESPTQEPLESTTDDSSEYYCYDHSDCDSPSAPFCYSFANYYDVDYGYCTSCDDCYYCSYGIDGKCGDACGQTTHFGADCNGNGDQDSPRLSWYGDGYPTAEECDWVEVSQNSHDWRLISNGTMDACIVAAWNNGCQSAKWHNDESSTNRECYCGYYDENEETVEAGSEYQACFLDDYRNYSNLTWITHFFASAGIAILALCIGGPIVFCLCACIGIYFCCCRRSRSNNNVQPISAQERLSQQQPKKLMIIPDPTQYLVQ